MRLTTSPQRRYRLADHVRACVHDGHVILLDLRRDKYVGIAGDQQAALSEIIAGWPAEGGASDSSSAGCPLESWLHRLAAQHMLSDASTTAPPCAPLAEPLESLDIECGVRPPRIGWQRPMNLAWAFTIATYWIKHLSLAEIESRIGLLRRPAGSGDWAASTAHLRDAVSSYTRLRPFVFTVHDQCLRDSLTLLRFLATEGLFAQWVIGVRTRPFAAHSWLQTGHVVLNDVREHVRTYTPILVV
ncbi:MAG TPA: lasso peptide biosynthesis B2 protein [Roseateles sp.]|uniref:lasso peptide biosynthesis B2 protein n=1 Tax=Roseateles sp. TaxID=1971397 RepID=UPI002EDA36A4